MCKPRRNDVREREVEQLTAGVSELIARGLVHLENLALFTDDKDSLRGQFHNCSQSFFALRERLLRPLALADV